MATAAETDDLPEFPLFDVTDVEVAMGADASRYYGGRGWDAAKAPCNAISRRLRAENKVGDNLFFSGGTLAEYGYRVKSDLDRTKVHRAITALMRSWGVSQQQKSGTLALAIHHWCEPIPADEQAAA